MLYALTCRFYKHGDECGAPAVAVYVTADRHAALIPVCAACRDAAIGGDGPVYAITLDTLATNSETKPWLF